MAYAVYVRRDAPSGARRPNFIVTLVTESGVRSAPGADLPVSAGTRYPRSADDRSGSSNFPEGC